MLNWLIYESDIYHVGGTVSYTGNIIRRKASSIIESANVTLGSLRVSCLMERFKDGSSVILSFIEDGVPMKKNSLMVDTFIERYDELKNSEPIYQEFVFYRNIYQVLVIIGQLFCVGSFLYMMFHLQNVINYWTYIIPMVVASILFILLCTCYSRIRTRDFRNFKTFAYSDDEDNN